VRTFLIWAAGILAAVVLHGLFLCFGGLIFPSAKPRLGTTQQVELLSDVDAEAEKKDEKKEPEKKVEKKPEPEKKVEKVEKVEDKKPEPVEKKPEPEKKADVDKKADKPPKNDEQPSSKFTLQLSSFQDKKEADTFLGTIKAAGYAAYITEADVSGKTFYRVRLGNYRTLEAANDAKVDVEKTLKKTATVMKL